jgi:hypothetical protein
MDASGDQSNEQQAGEKPIGIEEQRTMERQEVEIDEAVLGYYPKANAIAYFGEITLEYLKMMI